MGHIVLLWGTLPDCVFCHNGLSYVVETVYLRTVKDQSVEVCVPRCGPLSHTSHADSLIAGKYTTMSSHVDTKCTNQNVNATHRTFETNKISPLIIVNGAYSGMK